MDDDSKPSSSKIVPRCSECGSDLIFIEARRGAPFNALAGRLVVMVAMAIFLLGTGLSIHHSSILNTFSPETELGSSSEISRAVELGPDSAEAHDLLDRLIALERKADTQIQKSDQSLIFRPRGEAFVNISSWSLGWPSSWCWHSWTRKVSNVVETEEPIDAQSDSKAVLDIRFYRSDLRLVVARGRKALVFALLPIAFLGMTVSILAIGCRAKWNLSRRAIATSIFALLAIVGLLSFGSGQLDVRERIQSASRVVVTTITREQLRDLEKDYEANAENLLQHFKALLSALPESGASVIAARFAVTIVYLDRTAIGWPLPVMSIDSVDLQDAVAEPGMLAISEGAVCMRLPSQAGARRITSIRLELVSIAGNVVLISMAYILSGYFVGWFGHLRARRSGQLNTSCSECGYDLREQLRPKEKSSASSDKEET